MAAKKRRIKSLLISGMAAAAAFLCEKLTENFHADNFRNIKNGEVFLPIAAVFTAGMLVNSALFGNTVSSETEYDLLSALGTAAFYILGTLSVFCVSRVCAKNSEICSMLDIAVRRAENAENTVKKTRSFRHDINKHMKVLTGLLINGNTSAAEKYLSELGAAAAEINGRFRTGCAAADIIIGEAFAEAEKKGVNFSCKAAIPANAAADADICVILGNAIENAVKACEGLSETSDKFIEINAAAQGNILFIEVKNSFDGKPFKADVGLKNIEAAAKKYGGSVRIECGKNVFTLTVLLNISQQ